MPLSLPDLELPALPDLLQRLVGWCNVNSGSRNLGGLERMRAALIEAFSVLPGELASAELGTEGPRAFAWRCRPTAPTQVLLVGHFDTVYGLDHPFQSCSEVDADTLRGPGVADDKGGILVLFSALRAFERLAGAKRIGWEVILGPDEELGSPGSATLYRAAATRHHVGLVFEPARENGDLVRSRPATGVFTITCHGRAAHAGRDPDSGRNAVLALSEYLLAAARLPGDFSGVRLNVGTFQGGTAPNSVPDRATATVDVRANDAAEAERVVGRLRELARPIDQRPGYHLEIAGGYHRPPMPVTAESEALFAAYGVCGRDLGLRFGWQPAGGGSDANLLAAAGLPVLDGLGVVGGDLHSDREWAKSSTLFERARLTALFLARLNGQELVVPSSILGR